MDNNDYYNTNDPYSGYQRGAINNEILGSGNFEVIKGGTFYDADTYYYSTYNRRPQYGEELFENFRDFADIKNELYQYKWKTHNSQISSINNKRETLLPVTQKPWYHFY